MKSRLWKWVAVLVGIELLLGGAYLALRWTARSALNLSSAQVKGDPGGPLPVLYPVPEFALVDQEHRSVTRESLEGHVWIADFIFTHCTTVCPVLSARMVLLQRALKSPALRFVSISVDPVNDTETALKDYAARWNAPETRWHLLRTEPASLKDVAAGMKVAAMPSGDPDNPILHDAHFQLVDAKGQVRGIYDAADAEAMKTLQADVQRLLQEAPAAVPEVSSARSAEESGKQLYGELGCAGCHATKMAPPLEGVFGRQVMLTDGKEVSADEAYLRRAILEPGAEVVQGYSNLMPGYRGAVDDMKVDLLVAFLKSLAAKPGEASAPRAARIATVDPICGMSISAGPESPHEEDAQGKTVYFCSDTCRDRWLQKNPRK